MRDPATRWILILAALACLPAAASAHTVKGVVTGLDGMPVVDAIVELRHQTGEVKINDTVTNEDGVYKLLNLPTGIWELVVFQRGRLATKKLIRLTGPPTIFIHDLQLVDLGRAPQAFGLYLPPGQQVKKRALKHWQRARKALDKEEFGRVLKHLERAIEIDPGFARAHAELGIEYHRRMVWRMAELYYLKALELNPGDPVPMVNLAGLRLQQKRPVEAVSLLREAIRIDAALPLAHLYLGKGLLLLGEPAEATVALEQALELNPEGSSDIHRLLGIAYSQSEQLHKARDAYARFLERSPTSREASRVRQSLRELDERIDLKKRGIEPQPWSHSEIQ